MARNEEKAQSMLNRFLEMKRMEDKGPKHNRPFLATECFVLDEAERWRREILVEISKKVAIIQNTGLGEHKIRDLNDEINKLIREKGHWERRIVELGGPDHSKVATKVSEDEGALVPGKSFGYRYFGAAKDLPGVKELFQVEDGPKLKRTRYELYKNVDADYYGYRDDDDGILEPLEAAAEEKAIRAAAEKWEAEQRERERVSGIVMSQEKSEPDRFVAHVPVPSLEDIEKVLLKKRKEELMRMYAAEVGN
eukprot:TRINITY_DN1482_c0_g2_i3.p1 TRINITY_DN1482_c0_g2~~TRINITY_DN1482_c0_g2_i3.p1  ORF type:complete len:294 (-),score=86.09 TRINITY_DN1482_c0_g2_i3:299-1051(-)